MMDKKLILKSFLVMTRTCRYIYTGLLFNNGVSIMWKHCFEHHLLIYFEHHLLIVDYSYSNLKE